MTFLPVVERELRVAARKRSTFWLRVIAAIVAVIVGACVLFTANVGFNRGIFNIGGILFQTLTWMALLVAVFCGLFFTADCLSAEKREGTLGFLFLTDLRGYDVVAGKLFATSMRSVYALFAIFPVLAMIMLMGGVTGAQFWKTNLALLNAMVCSLIVGMFVSARSRDGQKALLATLLVLGLFFGGGPMIDELTGGYIPLLTATSPIYPFVMAASPRAEFWPSLVVCQLIAWGLFAWTCVVLPRRWQKDERARVGTTTGRTHFWKYGSSHRQARLRRTLLDHNPITWLISRERWQGLWLWFVVAIGIVLMSRLLFTLGQPLATRSALIMLWSSLQSAVTLFIYLWAASQATRFFVEAKRGGLLELLLASPLGVKAIVSGQWRAFVRTFALPTLVLVTMQVFIAPIIQEKSYATVTATTTPVAVTNAPVATTNGAIANTNSVTTTRAKFTIPKRPLVLAVATALAGAIAYVANLLAISWFGPWMAMTSKDASTAVLKTLVFVQLIPWFVIMVGASIVTMAIMVPMAIKGKTGTASMMWLPLAITGVSTTITLIKDIVFITWSRRKLYGSLREQAAALDGFRTKPPPIPQLRTLRTGL